MPDGTQSVAFVAPSVRVLRAHGPLTLREVTRETAKLLDCNMFYDDVDAVLERECRAGNVVCVSDAADYREKVWKATGPAGLRGQPLTAEHFQAACSPATGQGA